MPASLTARWTEANVADARQTSTHELKMTQSAFSDSSDDDMTPTTPTMPIRRVSLLTQSKPAQAIPPPATPAGNASPALTLDPTTLNELWAQATATVDHHAAQPHALEVWRVDADRPESQQAPHRFFLAVEPSRSSRRRSQIAGRVPLLRFGCTTAAALRAEGFRVLGDSDEGRSVGGDVRVRAWGTVASGILRRPADSAASSPYSTATPPIGPPPAPALDGSGLRAPKTWPNSTAISATVL